MVGGVRRPGPGGSRIAVGSSRHIFIILAADGPDEHRPIPWPWEMDDEELDPDE